MNEVACGRSVIQEVELWKIAQLFALKPMPGLFDRELDTVLQWVQKARRITQELQYVHVLRHLLNTDKRWLCSTRQTQIGTSLCSQHT